MTKMTKGKRGRKHLKLMIVIVLLVFLLSTGLLSFMYIGTVIAPSTPEEAEAIETSTTTGDTEVMSGVWDLGLDTEAIQ